MPVSAVVIHDTWYVSGLCGTGSNDFSATDLFVPEQRIFGLLDPSGHRGEPLYQMPPIGLFVFQLVCGSLGIARSALDDLTELAQTKKPSLATAVLADKAAAEVELARAMSICKKKTYTDGRMFRQFALPMSAAVYLLC